MLYGTNKKNSNKVLNFNTLFIIIQVLKKYSCQPTNHQPMMSNTMSVENESKGGKSVMVVLNGIKVSTEKKGVAPLKCALRDVIVAKDKVLVINIFSWKACTPSPASTIYCCLLENRNNDKGDGGQRDSYVKFLHEEINGREEACTNTFGPFYDKYCKSIGVRPYNSMF